MGSKHYLLVSDFDQTLSFNDSGIVLSELLGIPGFADRVAGLSHLNLVQEGAELAYLIRHDPEFRRVRYADLIEVGRRVRLKRNIAPLIALLARGIDGCSFQFYVVSAAPQEVVQSALEGLVPPSHIFATRFTYDPSGEVDSIVRVAAGHGKVAELEAIRARAGVPGERVVYVGDGTSDIRAMLHVNRMNGLTIAVSPARQITQIAKRTVLSDDALSVAIPILEDVAGYDAEDIRGVFDRLGFVIQDWDKVRTDWLTIRELNDESLGAVAVVA